MKSIFIPWDSRKQGFTPEMFKTTFVFRDIIAERKGEIPWYIVSGGKERPLKTPKEWSAKKQHYYAYVDMIVDNKVMKGRSMSLAALIWLCFLKKPIPAGYVVDHIDENPENNEPSNLQLLSIGANTLKARKLKKK